jgi:hypothetical protein
MFSGFKKVKIFSLATFIFCSACSTAQIQDAETLIQQNAAKIESVCATALSVAQNPMTSIFATGSILVSDMQKAVVAGCNSADGIAEMAKSASTIDWLGSAVTVMTTGGKTIPPVVKPVLISSAN